MQESADFDGAHDCYRGRSVMVTGAGGSIGSEIAIQLAMVRPSRLILLDHSEYALYSVAETIAPIAEAAGVPIVPILGSAGDDRLLDRILPSEGVEIVLHAAGYKHVPLVEANPVAGLSNNVIATDTLFRAAERAGIRRFVLISSDKAVRPAGLMGATKWIAEQLVQDLASRAPGIATGIVRFGNVLGSSGSVLPRFREQVERGGPVTVTDLRMERYFMSVGQAVQLVLEAGAIARNGEVYFFDMGPPVRIADLARQVIAAAGRTLRDTANPGGDIEMRETGLRPGEKLVEELTWSGQKHPTHHPGIFTATEPRLSEIEVARLMREVRAAVSAGGAFDIGTLGLPGGVQRAAGS
ncbi:polysaccharide biosynthesis protein [Rhodobacterales bacterium HKCCE3408]|nr:polysaccharide biosynthesis protein [Rhodobacterales bacterium HKCCE3408]